VANVTLQLITLLFESKSISSIF